MSICFAISDADLSLTSNIFGIAGNSATIIGVFFAVVLGLTWRSQVRAKNNHDVASRMLVQLYKFESLFSSSRIRGIYSHEVKFDPSEDSWADHNFRRLELGLERRIDKLNELSAEIFSVKFEASVLRDFDVSGLVSALSDLKNEYVEYARLTMLCSDPRAADDEKIDYSNEKAIRRDVFVDVDIFGRNYPLPNDSFGSDLESALRNLEKELKQKLI